MFNLSFFSIRRDVPRGRRSLDRSASPIPCRNANVGRFQCRCPAVLVLVLQNGPRYTFIIPSLNGSRSFYVYVLVLAPTHVTTVAVCLLL